MGEVKGLRSTDWQLQNSHRDVKYSIVSNIVITMYSARWVLKISEEHFVEYMIA